jgi:transposase
MERREVARSKKRWLRQKRTILFVDESGFYLLPALVSTWAPIGERPLLVEQVTNDHLSAIGGITLQGGLYMLSQECSFDGSGVVNFLEQLLWLIPGKLGIVWDGASIHHEQEVRDFLAGGGAERIELEMLPSYAPELNAAEGVWHYLKGVELRNVCCYSVAHLKAKFVEATRRLQARPDIIKACFHQPGCHYSSM